MAVDGAEDYGNAGPIVRVLALTMRPPLSWSTSTSASIWRRLRLPLALLALVLLGPAAYQLRRQFDPAVLRRRPAGSGAALTAAPPGSPGIGPRRGVCG